MKSLRSSFLAPASLGCTFLLCVVPGTNAQEAGLGRVLADPLADLDAVALRFDWDRQIGARDEGERQTLEAEPAFSFDLGSGARVVSRSRLPIVRGDGAAEDETGLGDALTALYYVPASSRGNAVQWGVGAVARLPTAADDALGNDDAAFGPALAASWTGRQWSWGTQLQHLLDGEEEGDLTLVQPYVARGFGRDWSAGVQVDAVYEWEGARLKGPLTLYARRSWAKGEGDSFAFDAGLRYWVDGPTEEPEWGARMAFTWIPR